jgi:adenine-specific DNA-methyltransferase
VQRDRPPGGGIKNPYVRFHKLDRPTLEVFPTTLWEYPSQNYGKGTQGSSLYRGATPSYVVWQVLQRFTREGQTILDPFCGSGTTLDVCKDLMRKGIGYDVSPVRPDVERADARALPLKDNSVDHVFLDPPYADNLRYSDDERCIGRLAAEDGAYQRAMAQVFDELARVVRKGGIVAVFVSDVQKADRFFPLGFELFALLAKRFTPVDHVVVARRGAKVESERALRQGAFGPRMQRGFSHLLIFKNDREAARVVDEPRGRRQQKEQAHAIDRRGGRGSGNRKKDAPPREREQRSDDDRPAKRVFEKPMKSVRPPKGEKKPKSPDGRTHGKPGRGGR